MNNKRIRYVTSIFTLDRLIQSVGITVWDDEDISKFVEEQSKHYGLKLISANKELLIEVEYTNIIWIYRVYYGSYKKRYHPLTINDERWVQIEKRILDDLKIFGMETLIGDVLINLKNKEYFEYKLKVDKQFKKYCIEE